VVNLGQVDCWSDGNANRIFSIIYFMEACMKNAKLTLMFLACAAAIPAFAQNSTDSRCGMTNFDRNRNLFTIVNPSPGMPNQQCFVTVVPKQSWSGGMPDLTRSELVEGNYEITLSGGGGGGGGGTERIGGGSGGEGAFPITTVRYLQPGVYRLTIGAGGQGGAPNGGRGAVGAPTSLANTNSGETFAGFSGAESWGGSYPRTYAAAPAGDDRLARGPKGEDGGRLTAVAYAGEPGKGGTDLAGDRFRHEVGGGGGGGAGFGNGGNGGSAAEDRKMHAAATSGGLGAGGGGGAGGEGVADRGAPGGNGFIRLALRDSPPPAASMQAEPAPAPAYVAPPPQAAPAEPAVVPARPGRTDRN
jgi:hypothetical protein